MCIIQAEVHQCTHPVPNSLIVTHCAYHIAFWILRLSSQPVEDHLLIQIHNSCINISQTRDKVRQTECATCCARETVRQTEFADIYKAFIATPNGPMAPKDYFVIKAKRIGIAVVEKDGTSKNSIAPIDDFIARAKRIGITVGKKNESERGDDFEEELVWYEAEEMMEKEAEERSCTEAA